MVWRTNTRRATYFMDEIKGAAKKKKVANFVEQFN